MPEDKQKLAFDLSLTPELLEIAKEAGNILMHYFDGKSPLKAIEKDDSSPVTQADIEADLFIRNALEQLCPHIPVVSEEGEKMDQEKRMSSPSIWLVDPLDGTRSFIRSSPEFAVCIGLVSNCSPEFGIIYLPFWQQLILGH
jgi:3'(2'), 5'-bisphosphate nucleotidase